jgi:tetratricopeptide (TPR) repeat protein
MQAASQAIKRGDWGRARQIYEALVARDPSDSEALAGIGDVDRAQGNMSGAIAAYKRALGVNPSYMPALLGVADTQWASGNRAEATRAYKDIADRFPEGTYPSYVKTRAEGPPPAENAASAGAKGGSSGGRDGL